jgi:hypothetical protein
MTRETSPVRGFSAHHGAPQGAPLRVEGDGIGILPATVAFHSSATCSAASPMTAPSRPVPIPISFAEGFS